MNDPQAINRVSIGNWLAINLLYLKETDWGKVDEAKTKTLSAGAWGQYFLDNHATVEEAIKDMANPPFGILASALPNGHAAGIHLSISDANGDSAILEYIEGKLEMRTGASLPL